MEKAAVFEKTLRDYLQQVVQIKGKEKVAAILGVEAAGDGFRIPFLHRTCTVTAGGIFGDDGKRAPFATAVVLCKYLLLCPERPPAGPDLVTFKDFKDAAPLVGYFRTSIEQPIAAEFTGAPDRLEAKCLDLGGEFFATKVSCRSSFRFLALPRVPVFLLFDDADEDFPARSTLLFQMDAASYLDMECLAMAGSALSQQLRQGR